MFVYEAKKEPQQKLPTNFNVKTENVLQQKNPHTPQGNGCMLPSDVCGQLENLTGFSFADVQVYYNSEKPDKLAAYAYTQGNKIYLGPGQEHHLLHELGHVIQQKKGPVKPTTKLNCVDINDDPRLEQEADNILNMSSTQNTERLDILNSPVLGSSVIQRRAYLRKKPLDVINALRKAPGGNTAADFIEKKARSVGLDPSHHHIFFDTPKTLPIVGNSTNIGFTVNPVDITKSIFNANIIGKGDLFADNTSVYSDIRQISNTADEDDLLVTAIHNVGLQTFGTYDLWTNNCQKWAVAVENEYHKLKRGKSV